MRIKRPFNRAHRSNTRCAVFADQCFALANANAVLARAGTANRQRVRDHSLIDFFRLSPTGRIIGFEDKKDVEIAIADMAEDWRE